MQRTLALVLLLGLLPVPGVAGEAEEVSVRTLSIPSWDGTVLAADLYWPVSAEQAAAPAVLMTHGWGGSKADVADEARWLAGSGHVVLAYDSRGFGASEGTVGLDGPDEWADASHLVTVLAGLQGGGGPRVLLDDAATDDPRVGMYGYSYGGAIQLLAAAHDERIDAIAPDITWSDLQHSLAPNGVVKRGWLDLLFWGGLLGAHGARTGSPNAGGMDARLQEWYLAALQTGRFPAEAGPALEERSPRAYLDDISIPVLLTQGWKDTLFVPDEAVATYSVLAARDGVETSLLLHPGGHGHTLGAAARDVVRAEVDRFFDRHLWNGTEDGAPAVRWFDADAGTWREAAGWPVPATRGAGLAFATAASITLAQAPAATSHTETQELEGTLGTTGPDPGALPTAARIALDGAGPVAFLGAPVVRLNVTPSVDDATLFLSLVDVGLDGTSRTVGNQVQPVRIEGSAGVATEVEVRLVSVAHTWRLGHGLELRIATSDTAYLGSREPGTLAIDLATGVVEVPLLDREALGVVQPPGGVAPPQAKAVPGPAVGALFLVAAALLAWRNDRRLI